jgi:ribosomal protein S18 acetylase RimI-like enzyme
VSVEIRRLSLADLPRIGEIDRSESVRFTYVYNRGALTRISVDHDVPRWSDDTVAAFVRWLTPMLESGGVIVGALDGPKLVGVALLNGEFLGEGRDQLQMAFLHVGNGHRRLGIARTLMDEMCTAARERGARRLYVSATESESAVGFYLSYGCRLAEKVDPALYAAEPKDIHLTLDL